METAYEQNTKQAVMESVSIMPETQQGEKDCLVYSEAALRLAGWTFARLFHFFFDEITLILSEEGKKGGDLRISITKGWLEENHVKRFIPPEGISDLNVHLETCPAEACRQARKALIAINQIFTSGKLPGAGLLKFIPRVYRRRRMHCILGRQSNREIALAIAEIKPFLELCLRLNDEQSRESDYIQ